MRWWAWLLIAMVVLSIVGGSAEKRARWDVASSTQSAINLGWIILFIVLIGAMGTCMRDAACDLVGF